MKPWMTQRRIENSGWYPPPNELNETNTCEPPDWPVIEKKGWHHAVCQLSKQHSDLFVFIFYLSVIEYLWILQCQHNGTQWQIFLSLQKGSNDRNQSCENVLL